MSEPIGIILTGDNAQFDAAYEKSDAVVEMFGKSVETASVTTRKAMLAYATAADAASKATAGVRLQSALAMDALTGQAAAATKVAKASVSAAAAERAAGAESIRLAGEVAVAESRAARAAADAGVREAARAEAAAVASYDREMVAAERASVAEVAAAERAGAARRAQNASLASSGLGAVGAGGAASGIARAGIAADSTASKLKTMGAVGSIALLGIGYESTKAAVTFEQSTTRLQTQAHVTAGDMKVMSDGVLKLSGQTATGPNALAEAIYHVASAGYQGADSLTIMKQAALGAKVGNANLDDTTNALVGTMKALDAPASDATKTMASLNAIVGAGKMTMDDLNGALATGIVPTARAFGVSLDSVGAALAYMTDRGTPADSAATRLRMSLTLMADPASKAAKALAAIGLDGPTVQAATQAMADALHKANLTTTKMSADLRKPDGIMVALKDLRQHLADSGVSADAATAIMAKAFGGGKSDAAIIELIQNVGGLKQKFDQIGAGAAGFGDDVTNTSKTAAYQLAQVKANFEAIGITIGNTLLPAVKAVTSALANNKGAVEAVAVVIGTVLVGSIIGWTLKMGVAVAESIAGFGAVTVAAEEAGAASTLAFGPIGIAIAGVTVAGFELAKHWHSIWGWIDGDSKDGAKKSAQNIVETYNSADESLHQSGMALSTNLANGIAANSWQPIDAVTRTAKSIVSIASTAAQTALNVMSSIPAWDATNGGLPKQSLATILGGAQGDGANANPVPGVQGVGGSLAQLLAGTVKGKKYSQAIIDAAKNVNLMSGLDASGQYAVGGSGAGGLTPTGLPDGAGGFSPTDSGSAGHKGKTTAKDTPYSKFARQLSDFDSTEKTDFLKQEHLSTQKQIAQAEKTDGALEKLAESHLKHAKTLVKTAKTVNEKKAASTLLHTAHTQLNAVTKQLIKVENEGAKLAADAKAAATALADAKLEATSNMQDQATADAVHIKEAKEKLDADKVGTLAYWQDLKAYNEAVATGAADAAAAADAAKQAQIDLANAMVEAGINYADPLSGLKAAVTEAQNALAGDTPGTTKFYLDTAALNRANQDLVNALSQNTTATDANTTGMTGGPLNELPGYAALRAGANAEAYLGGSGGGISGPRTSRNGGSQAPIYITIDVQTNDADAIAKALNVRLSRAGSAIRL